MVKISRTEKRFGAIETSSLAKARILERYDLQEYIFNSPAAFCAEVGQEMMFVGQEVRPSDNVADRIDLLAIDPDGDMIIVELKRGNDKLQLLQAVAYAAMIAKLSPDEILKRDGNDLTDGIMNFVGEDSEINGRQRILLIAEDFDYEVLVAAEWLFAKGVEIDCVRVALAVDSASEYLTFTQLFPTPKLAEQARKRGREASGRPPRYASWPDVLADASNVDAVNFFKRYLATNIKSKLRYTEIDFGPTDRVTVHLRDSYASVSQFCTRFPGDIGFWETRVIKPVNVWTKRHKDDSLRFRLSTAEDFAAFEKAVGELPTAGWTNDPAEFTEAASA